MNVPVLKRIINPLGLLDYQASWLGLLHIFLWTVFFLLLARLVFPELPMVLNFERRLTKDTSVSPMFLLWGQPGWLRKDFETFPKSEQANIAWVGESSVNLREKGKKGISDLMSLAATRTFNEKYGYAPNIYTYTVHSRKALDLHTLVKDAIARNPDMLVITINPFWDYNSSSIFYRNQVFKVGAKRWWNAQDWPKQFLMAAPTDHFYNAAGQYIPLMMAPAQYSRSLHKYSKGWFGSGEVKKYNALTRKKNRHKENYRHAFDLWFRDNEEKMTETGEDTADKKPHNRQSKVMALNVSSHSHVAKDLIGEMFETLEASGIPALIYLDPIAEILFKYPDSRAGYQYVKNALTAHQSKYQSEKIGFIIDFPSEVYESLSFRDYIHLSDAGMLPEFLTDKMHGLLMGHTGAE